MLHRMLILRREGPNNLRPLSITFYCSYKYFNCSYSLSLSFSEDHQQFLSMDTNLHEEQVSMRTARSLKSFSPAISIFPFPLHPVLFPYLYQSFYLIHFSKFSHTYDQIGSAALISAALKGNFDVVKQQLERGIAVNETDGVSISHVVKQNFANRCCSMNILIGVVYHPF